MSFTQQLLGKSARAHRAYLARKRRRLKVEVPGPERIVYRDGKELVEVVKEVIRYVDQIVLIPWRGIRWPLHINPLVRKGGLALGHQQDGDVDERSSNVAQFKKA